METKIIVLLKELLVLYPYISWKKLLIYMVEQSKLDYEDDETGFYECLKDLKEELSI